MDAALPKLVLMPGMDGSGELFRHFEEALPKELTAAIVRYPADMALGYSGLMEYVRLALPKDEPFVLVAESFSVPLAILTAATYPTHLQGVVLCAGFAKRPVRGWTSRVGLWMVAGLRLADRVFGHVTLPGFVVERLLLGAEAPKALVDSVREAVSWVKPRVIAERLRAVLTCDVLAALATVNVPVLYVQATQDELIDPECVGEMQLAKRGKTVAIFGPHLLFQREPQVIAGVVTAFVREMAGENDVAA